MSPPGHDEVGPVQRAVELGCILAAAVLLACHAIRLAVTLGRACWWQVLAAAAGVLSADLVSGMVHWTADTWGNETMPLLGRRFIRPFRVHHVNPDDFLQRDIIDTNGDVSMLVLLPLLAAFRIPWMARAAPRS